MSKVMKDEIQCVPFLVSVSIAALWYRQPCLPGHPMTVAVLREMTKGTLCNKGTSIIPPPHTHTHTHTHTHNVSARAYTRAREHTHTHTHMHVHIHTHTLVRVCMCIASEILCIPWFLTYNRRDFIILCKSSSLHKMLSSSTSVLQTHFHCASSIPAPRLNVCVCVCVCVVCLTSKHAGCYQISLLFKTVDSDDIQLTGYKKLCSWRAVNSKCVAVLNCTA
jgi:hypothetical protein